MFKHNNKIKKESKKKKKENFCIADFAVRVDHRVIIQEAKKKDKYLDLAWELWKLWNMKVTVIPIVIGTLRTVPTSCTRLAGRVGHQRMNRDHPSYSIVKDWPENWEESRRTEDTCNHLYSSETPADVGVVNMNYLLFDNPSYKRCTFPLVKKKSSQILNWIKDY